MESQGVYPLSKDVEDHIKKVAAKFPKLTRLRRVGRTLQGRPIYAVTITDPKVPDANKQNVLVLGGKHGNEESGRIVALAVIDWLVGKSALAKETRKKQKIVVMPNCNPDGCETNDHGNSKGDIRHLNIPDGATDAEGIAIQKVMNSLQSELYIDMHACGGAGCGTDMVAYPWCKDYTIEDYILHRIAHDMLVAGERAGIPQMTFPMTWPGWGEAHPKGAGTFLVPYLKHKSLAFLTENSESDKYTYSIRERARAGLAKVKAAFKWGNRRFPKLYYPGYPNMMVGGQFHLSVNALGKTTAARRRSRVALWENVYKFKKLGVRIPAPPKHKSIVFQYGGKRLKTGCGIQSNVRGKRRVNYVTLNGRKLKRSETSGYVTWRHGPATYVVVAIPDLSRGTYKIEIDYK